MLQRRLLAAIPILLGVILLVSALLGSVEQRLVPAGLPSETHVTALTTAEDGTLFAATQSGEVWQYRDRLWTTQRLSLGGKPIITVLSGDPTKYPLGTSSGLRWRGGEPPPGNPHVLDILQSDDALILATRDGLRVFVDGRWERPSPTVFSYRLQAQQRDGKRYVHVGTIGQGVYSVDAGGLLDDWQANSRGLPAEAKILSFAVTAGGRLLAGTDAGLYWQGAPGETWQALDEDLAARRILALHRASTDGTSSQRLWIGSDDGLLAIDLAERPDGLASAGPARSFTIAGEAPGVGISAIVALDQRLLASAGTVYELTEVRNPSWYLSILAGVGLLILGGWTATRSPPADEATRQSS